MLDKSVQRRCRAVAGLVAFVMCFGVSIAKASAGGAAPMTFALTTAPEAALGAPIGYLLTVTNTGSTTQTITSRVDLIAPDGTLYNVYTSTPTYLPGQTRKRDSNFISKSVTPQTGDFIVQASITDKSGTVLAQQSFPMTVVPVPTNGVYASIGGVGPNTQLLGFRYDFKTVVANLSTAAMSVKTKTTLIYSDGTEKAVSPGVLTTINAGSSTISRQSRITTSQYTNSTGTFSVRVDVLDGSNNVLATQTRTFTRGPLPPDYYPPTFAEVSAVAGVRVKHNTDSTGCMTTMIGEGAAVGDYDGDGLQDIFATDQVLRSHLWHNNGNGTFTDLAAAAGIPVIPRAAGANFVDFNNDGHPDLFILVQGGQNVLLRNNGDGTFTDITAGSGLSTPVNQTNVSASWGDYDGDGYLDVYVAVHTDCTSEVNNNDHLFHNEGGTGKFTDVSNLVGGSTEGARGLAVVFFDYDQDGRPDIYVANDRGGTFGPNKLWHNEGPDGIGGWKKFTDVSKSTNTGLAMSAMGIGVGDYDRDGRFDMIVTNLGDNKLLHQNADGTFTEVADLANVQRTTMPMTNGLPGTSVTWGTAFSDFNNDGWEDIYMAAGSLGEAVDTDAFLLNNRDGTFLDLSLLSGAADPGKNRSVVFADFNEDGFIDIFNAALAEVPQLYINNARSNGNPYHYLRVKLIGTTSNRDAVGARLVANVGGAQLMRQVINGATFQGNSELVVHFGLGSAAQVDTLTIYWPSGKVQTLNSLLADQKLVITEP